MCGVGKNQGRSNHIDDGADEKRGGRPASHGAGVPLLLESLPSAPRHITWGTSSMPGEGVSDLTKGLFMQLTIKNYRCFSDQQPARFQLRRGFTALVGPNNTGKSSLLKLIYEFRTLWEYAAPMGNFLNLLSGGAEHVGTRAVADPQDVFCDRNDRPLEIAVEFSLEGPPTRGPRISRAVWKMDRGRPDHWTLRIDGEADFTNRFSDVAFRDDVVMRKDEDVADTRAIIAFGRLLKDSVYLGPFRNAINAGAVTITISRSVTTSSQLGTTGRPDH
jgi:hypothetical protein